MVLAYRGTEQFANESSLKSHIAQLLKSDNIGLVLGSGASVSAGGLIMSELWEFFKTNYPESYKWLIDEGFISADNQISNQFVAPNQIVGKLMDELTQELEANDKLDNAKFRRLIDVKRDLVRSVVHAALLDMDLWKQPPEKRLNSQRLRSHIQMLQKIKDYREPTQQSPFIFTPNYDLAIEWAAGSLGMTINDGFYRTSNASNTPIIFSPPAHKTDLTGIDENYSKHLNLIKLHGSLNWEMAKNQVIQLKDSRVLTKTRNFMFDKSSLPELLIFPGGHSYVKDAGPIHEAMLQQYKSFFKRPNPALFVVGYGFSDHHINIPIFSMLTQKLNLNVVIYYPEFTGLGNCDEFPNDLRNIIGLESSCVTIIGGGESAYFNRFADQLPKI